MIKGVEQLDEEQQSGIMLFMLLKIERNIMGLKVPGICSEKIIWNNKEINKKKFIISSSLKLRTYQ